MPSRRSAQATAAALLALVAGPASVRAEGWAPHVGGGVGAEASVIGDAYGVRPELTIEPHPGSVHRLRLAAGYLVGPELSFVPIDLGYRAVFRQHHRVQPLVGAGWESQHFFISDAPTVHRWAAVYLEGGAGVRVGERFSVGLAVSVDFAFGERPGPGLQLRAFATFR